MGRLQSNGIRFPPELHGVNPFTAWFVRQFRYLVRVPTDIKDLTREELEIQFKSWEQPVYRVTQLLEWLYVRHATSWDAMTNLPKKLRAQLAENYSLK